MNVCDSQFFKFLYSRRTHDRVLGIESKMQVDNGADFGRFLSGDIMSSYFLKGARMAGTQIAVRNNGPLRIEGDFAILDQDGNEFGLGGRTTVSLCRCGHSNSKPFCDGSHNGKGFQAQDPARDLPPKPTP